MLKPIICGVLVLNMFAGLQSEKFLLAQEQNLEGQKKFLEFQKEQKKEQNKLKNRVPKLIKELDNSNWVAREKAILLLSRSKDPKAIEPLAKVMVEDSDKGIRKMTAQMLSGFNDKKIVPIFKKQVLENGEHKIIGATVLMKLGNEEEKKIALPILEKYAEEGHPEVLSYSKLIDYDDKKGEIRKRVYYDKNKAKIIMNKLLNHKDELVCAEAVYYLHDMGDKDIVQGKIENILKSENPRVKNIGKSILKQIGDEKSKKRLQELEYQELQKELKDAEQKRDKKEGKK
ncbi:MAG: HEAT repeat domain-containing protein [Elusimicrobiota bacterium]